MPYFISCLCGLPYWSGCVPRSNENSILKPLFTSQMDDENVSFTIYCVRATHEFTQTNWSTRYDGEISMYKHRYPPREAKRARALEVKGPAMLCHDVVGSNGLEEAGSRSETLRRSGWVLYLVFYEDYDSSTLVSRINLTNSCGRWNVCSLSMPTHLGRYSQEFRMLSILQPWPPATIALFSYSSVAQGCHGIQYVI